MRIQQRERAVLAAAAFGCLLLTGCGSSGQAEDTAPAALTQQETAADPVETVAAADTEHAEVAAVRTAAAPADPESPEGALGVEIPEEIEEIPEDYFAPADRQGTLEELSYDTWESFSYEEKTTPLTKHAVVYLPYGYDETQQYDVFYLMHGGWSDYTTTLGTPEQPSEFKNVLDHAIAQGELEPLIVVCPTYNNTNEDGLDSDSFSLAMQLTEQFHNELLNDLMPAVEGRYATWAEGTAPENFEASRDHRGFGGFSMGSVNTWRTFAYDLPYFRYFLPMSCGTSLEDEQIWQAAEGRDPGDYFVFVMTGTEDFAYRYDVARTEKMAASRYFTDVDEDPSGNMAFRVKEGYAHGAAAAMEYTYNGMKAFFGKKEAALPASDSGSGTASPAEAVQGPYTRTSRIRDVMSDPDFGSYGRLLLPVEDSYWSGDTLEDLDLVWYNDIDPDTTVEIVNTLKQRAAAGETVFYDIYTDAEKAEDPEKENTGLFFFKGQEGAKTAIVNAGGGFAYVGAMQDSFPVSLDLSKKGYNAFALIYRPGADTACEDLARAVAWLSDHARELGIDMTDYSLWGGSAGARMAAWVGTYGTAQFGEKAYPKPAVVIMQYTGLSEVTGEEPPTYACVGTSDGIASWRTMENRIDAIRANGTNAEIEIFQGLPHGFGLGTGTVAEGWTDHAVRFWEENMTS